MFCEEIYNFNSRPAQYQKKIKWTKIILKKIIIKKKQNKTMGGINITIHIIFFKKNTKLNSQPTQYLKIKIDKDNFEKNH